MLTDAISQQANTTMEDHIRGSIDLTMRDRPVFALMKKRNKIKTGQAGEELTWRVKFSLPESTDYQGGQIDFESSDKYRKMAIDWRKRIVPEFLSREDERKNRGAAAIVNRLGEMAEDMLTSMNNFFEEALYTDGTTYTTYPHGLETFMSDDGNTVVADLIAKPDSTYATRDCTTGVDGEWSTNLGVGNYPNATIARDWPRGTGDPEFDHVSPRLMNWSSNAWGTGSVAWIDNLYRCLSRAILWTKQTTGRDGLLDMFLMDEAMYWDVGNYMETKGRIQVGATAEMKELGFDGYRIEGVNIMSAYGVPANTFYGLNIDQMELRSLEDQLFVQFGPEWSTERLGTIWLLWFYGNWRFKSPKFFCKGYNYASS